MSIRLLFLEVWGCFFGGLIVGRTCIVDLVVVVVGAAVATAVAPGSAADVAAVAAGAGAAAVAAGAADAGTGPAHHGFPFVVGVGCFVVVSVGDEFAFEACAGL